MVERGGREGDRAGWVKCLVFTGSNPDTSGSLPVGIVGNDQDGSRDLQEAGMRGEGARPLMHHGLKSPLGARHARRYSSPPCLRRLSREK